MCGTTDDLHTNEGVDIMSWKCGYVCSSYLLGIGPGNSVSGIFLIIFTTSQQSKWASGLVTRVLSWPSQPQILYRSLWSLGSETHELLWNFLPILQLFKIKISCSFAAQTLGPLQPSRWVLTSQRLTWGHSWGFLVPAPVTLYAGVLTQVFWSGTKPESG